MASSLLFLFFAVLGMFPQECVSSSGGGESFMASSQVGNFPIDMSSLEADTELVSHRLFEN